MASLCAFSSVSATLLTMNQTAKLPRVICRICRRLFHEAGASLQWHANARGRAVCPHCRN